MKIIELSVKQTRIYEVDKIPFSNLYTYSWVKKIYDNFNFVVKDSPFMEDKLVFNNGEFAVDGRNVIIESLEIESRRILLTIVGDSKTADHVGIEIENLISELNGQKLADVLVKFDETTCVMSSKVNFFAIFTDEFNDYLKNTVLKSTSSQNAKSLLKSARMRFQLRYEPGKENLSDYNVYLSEKTFVIEPREGTPFNKNIFFTFSPTDSDSHLKILQDFEKRFA